MIGAFKYAAESLGFKESKPHYRSASDVVRHAREFLSAFGQPGAVASPRDAANVGRMVEILTVLVGSDFGNVEVMIAREWMVRGKPYKVTWSIGMFISEMKSRKQWHDRQRGCESPMLPHA